MYYTNFFKAKRYLVMGELQADWEVQAVLPTCYIFIYVQTVHTTHIYSCICTMYILYTVCSVHVHHSVLRTLYLLYNMCMLCMMYMLYAILYMLDHGRRITWNSH